MKFLFHDPMETMLDRFNKSERERLLPVWRRVAIRLRLTMIILAVLVLWACEVLREAH